MCRLAMRPSSVSSSMSITSKGAFRPLVQAAGSWPERFAVLDEEFIGLLLWPALRARDAGALIKFLVDEETAVYGEGIASTTLSSAGPEVAASCSVQARHGGQPAVLNQPARPAPMSSPRHPARCRGPAPGSSWSCATPVTGRETSRRATRRGTAGRSAR